MSNDLLFERRPNEDHDGRVERIRKVLRVPMTHPVGSDEYWSVLSYRVDQEIAAAEERVEALRRLRDTFTA